MKHPNAMVGWLCSAACALAILFNMEWYHIYPNLFLAVVNFYWAGYFTKE